MRTPHPRRRSPVAAVVTGALVLTLTGTAIAAPDSSPDTADDPSAAAADTTAPAPADAPAAADGDADAVKHGPTVTLLSGDQVRVNETADGEEVGEVVHDAEPLNDIAFRQTNDATYAFPAAALSLISDDRLDPELFNVTTLVADGHDDKNSDEIPTIAQYDEAQPGARNRASVTSLAVPAGAERTQPLASIGAQALTFDKATTDDAWTALIESPKTAPDKLWLDGKVEASLDVSVPAIGAPAAWDAGFEGSGVKIAVLDTGIDTDHPDFADRIVATESFIDGETVEDTNGHGSHVASIAAGSGADSDGAYRGVAPGADLVIGKVLDASGSGTTSGVIAGMEWAAAQGADVVNLSLGGAMTDGTDPQSQALNRISEETGTLFVVAAGNNGRSGAETVQSPGSADHALTVGSVSKTEPYGVSVSSSRGPRPVDGAIKPEITAPGASIVAARVGGGYVGYNGTSMASPHVAGAVAVLAQQHPDWDADQIRNALISTANPNPHDGVTEQGGGMVDLERATTAPLVATGVVNLGADEPPYESTSGTVTFHNLSDQPVQADLSLDLYQGLAGTEAFTAPDGAVTFTPAALDIGPGESATVEVTVDSTDLEIDAYFGRLEARSGDSVLARSTLSWTKSPQRHTLNATGIDRLGVPALTADCSFVDLLNLDTGERIPGWWDGGQAYALRYGGPDIRLPEGRYAMSATVCTYNTETPYYHLATTAYFDPEFTLDGDRTIDIDARSEEAQKLEFETPRAAVSNAAPRHLVRAVRQIVVHEDGVVRYPTIHAVASAPEVYIFPNDTEVTDGTFETRTSSYLVAPPLTMQAFGRGDQVELDVLYPGEGERSPEGCDELVTCHGTFDERGRYDMVDGGAGTPAELDAADVAGKLVLVDETWGDVLAPWLDPSVDQVAADAKAAGAAGVVIAAAFPDRPHHRLLDAPVELPVATVSQEVGQRLSDLLGNGPVRVRTGGEPVAPYLYDLYYEFDTFRLPEKRIEHRDLATVNARYHTDVPGTVGSTGAASSGGHPDSRTRFEAPHVRTEYRTPESVGYRRILGSVGEDVYTYAVGPDSTVREAEVVTLEAGERVTIDYGDGVPVTPGQLGDYPIMAADKLTTGTRRPRIGGSFERFGTPDGRLYWGYPITIREGWQVRHDGEVLAEGAGRWGARNIYTPPGADRFQFEVFLEQDERSINTGYRTVWDFSADFSGPDGSDPIHSPIIELDYDIELNLDNSVTAGRRHDLTVQPAYQRGYEGDGDDEFTVEAWISYDDGQTWEQVEQRRGRDTSFGLVAPEDAEFATLRTKATDTEGNSIDETVTRVWKVTPRG